MPCKSATCRCEMVAGQLSKVMFEDVGDCEIANAVARSTTVLTQDTLPRGGQKSGQRQQVSRRARYTRLLTPRNPLPLNRLGAALLLVGVVLLVSPRLAFPSTSLAPPSPQPPGPPAPPTSPPPPPPPPPAPPSTSAPLLPPPLSPPPPAPPPAPPLLSPRPAPPPAVLPASSPACSPCYDSPGILRSYFDLHGYECDTYHFGLLMRCNRSSAWRTNRVCARSCYFAGSGYAGDFCCAGVVSPRPPLSPRGPAPPPTVRFGSLYGCSSPPELCRTCKPSSPSTFAFVSVHAYANTPSWNEQNRLVVGALSMNSGLRLAGSQYPLVLATTYALDTALGSRLARAQIGTKRIPLVSTDDTNFGCFRATVAKLAIWSLVDFERVVLLDLDMLVMCNLDQLARSLPL